MNIQEIDKWLDNEYGMSYTKLEELHNYFFEKYTDQKEEIERLNNIINELKNENEKLYNLCETNNVSYLQGLEDGEIIKDFKYSDFVKKWLKVTKEKLQRGDIYEQTNNSRKE